MTPYRAHFAKAFFLFLILQVNLPGFSKAELTVDKTSASPRFPKEFLQSVRADENHLIRVTVDMPRLVLENSPVLVDASVINGRSEQIELDHDTDVNDFSLSVYDGFGHPVPRTEAGKKIDPRFRYEFVRNMPMKLAPGQQIRRQYDLAKYFKISTPGQYRLTIIKTIAGTASFPRAGDELEISIDGIPFDVLKAPSRHEK